MLVNLSNHVSSKWSNKQLCEAQKYGTVIDIQFPNIDPTASKAEIYRLADDYLNRIMPLVRSENTTHDETTVHVMGEMTFVHAFVTRAEQFNIKCIASTTQRVVEELPDGKKTVTFEFVQFRHY